MAAPQGNKFWMMRSSHGRNPTFASPEELWNACVEYFEWVEANPLYEDNLVTYQGAVKHEPTAKMRAMTLEGLYIFLDISRPTWAEYRKKTEKGFSAITTRVEEIIRTQKFTGAAADLLNANIIARELGLADKAEHSGPRGGPIETLDVMSLSPAERAQRLAAIMSARQSEAGQDSEPDPAPGGNDDT